MELKGIVLSDRNISPILRFLSQPADGLCVNAEAGPYDQVHQVLMNSNHPIWRDSPDVLFIWTSPEGMIPGFRQVLEYNQVTVEHILTEVDHFVERIIHAAARVKITLVASWSVPPHVRWMQSQTYKQGVGMTNILVRMNLRIAERIAEHSNIILLDSQYWQAASSTVYDAKMYALGKIPYTRSYFSFVSNEILAVLKGVYGLTKKLIICDLDNTLWGGVIGDDGKENIKLGGIDPIGESFKQFQSELLKLKRRGILLAVCSKNNETVALEMINDHPEMVLRKTDFSSLKINWKDKAENVQEIVTELNLGYQSVIFLDDSPTERERIRQVFPEIYTPDLPEDITQFPVFLSGMNCFESMGITKEDLQRTEWYEQESKRNGHRLENSTLEAWLESLGIIVTVYPLVEELLPRAVQLLNKTNQFNMSTKRYSLQEYWDWSNLSDNFVFVFHTKDKFGEAGYTGLISATIDNGTAIIIDFIMSCRVMGKQIEEAMLFYLIDRLTNIKEVRASYIATNKNKPFWEFIRNKYISGNLLDLASISLPKHIQLIEGKLTNVSD